MTQFKAVPPGKQLLERRYYTSWELMKAYWRSEHKVYAYFILVVITIMTIGMVGFDVGFSYWSNYFYNALQAYDKNSVFDLVILFFVLAGFFIILAVYRYYISQFFGLRWRNWLTQQYVTRWLQKRDYYYLEVFDKSTDNPDQRIQEDIGSLTTTSITLFTGLVNALTTFVGFIFVLWKLSGEINLSLGSLGVLHIPGYLVWVAILYSGIGTYITFKIGRPLVNLNFEQQKLEASFRFAAIDLRSHAENVALYRGEAHQTNILYRLFDKVLNNWYMIILRQKMLLWFTAGFNQLAVLLPLLVALPNYFRKVFLLGGLMQSLRAFNQIQEALAFLVNSFTQIAEWKAINKRLTTFINHLEDVELKAKKYNKVHFSKQTENEIRTQHLTIMMPNNTLLLENINETFKAGQYYLIQGESGIGKSTFIRTIAGIWPFAAGDIYLPQHKKVMYLPQRPYMPIGTLAEAIIFPDHIKPTQADFEHILQVCNLEEFIPRLQEATNWSQQLSPGEQQRISFARVLVQQPDWIFLDESTSMLDLNNEKRLYKVLRDHLPHCAVISVGHRASLNELHDHLIEIEKYAPQALNLAANEKPI